MFSSHENDVTDTSVTTACRARHNSIRAVDDWSRNFLAMGSDATDYVCLPSLWLYVVTILNKPFFKRNFQCSFFGRGG